MSLLLTPSPNGRSMPLIKCSRKGFTCWSLFARQRAAKSNKTVWSSTVPCTIVFFYKSTLTYQSDDLHVLFLKNPSYFYVKCTGRYLLKYNKPENTLQGRFKFLVCLFIGAGGFLAVNPALIFPIQIPTLSSEMLLHALTCLLLYLKDQKC